MQVDQPRDPRQLDLGVLGFRRADHAREPAAGILVDGERCEERGIKVARRKPESRPAIAARDHREIVGAHRIAGAAHAGGAVVIGGERERPGAQQAKIVGEQLHRALGGAERVITLIDRSIDAQVELAGARHELPKTGGADFRARERIERGLHMRQRDELRRQTGGRERASDMRAPGPRALETGAETVRLTELETHATGRLTQRRGRRRRALGAPDPERTPHIVG